jgi:hypothetical protein
VHQHGTSIVDSNHQDMRHARDGLTSKIHAVVDTDGMPDFVVRRAGEGRRRLFWPFRV